MIHNSGYYAYVFVVLTLAGLLLAAGCKETGISAPEVAEIERVLPIDEIDTIAKAAVVANHHAAGIQRNLAELRRATAPFHNIDKAEEADYDTPITPCWYHSELGSMGYHYGNLALLDGIVELLKPEALMYEPGPGGHYRLVGMEYIVPMDAWDGEGNPTLLGQEYHPNETLGLYTLHVWLWRNNPNGMFSAWNPKVSCEYAQESEDRAGL